MKLLYFILFFVSLNFCLLSQKQIKDYSLQELNLKKKEAINLNDINNIEVFDLAIKYKAEIDAAIKVEDFDKAALFQDKLIQLKIIPLPAEKIKQLQNELNEAIAKEDFNKAESLKNEIDILKGNKPKPINNSENTAKNSTSSNLTKNNIYDFSVVWMGLDFSLFNFISSKKVGEELEYKKNILIWQKEFHSEIGSEKLGKWLKKTKFIDDRSFSESLYNNNLNRSWIKSQKTTLSIDKIQKHLLSYKSSNHGIALVFIPEIFDENEKEIIMNIVWFDVDTKAIIHNQSVTFKGVNTGTMTNRWGGALIDCTKTYVDQYFRKKL